MYSNMPDHLVLATRPIVHDFKPLTSGGFTPETLNEYLDRFFTVVQIDDFADDRLRDLSDELAKNYWYTADTLHDFGKELLFHIRDAGLYTYGMLAYGFKYMKGDGSVVMERVFDVNTGDVVRQSPISSMFGQRRGI